jgi:AraC-like DNA-binding protein
VDERRDWAANRHVGGAMRVYQQNPRPALLPFIQTFKVVEFSAFHRDVHLPEPGTVAAFSFRGGCRLDDGRTAPRAAFTGVYETLRGHEHSEDHGVLLTTFSPTGATALLPPALGELAGTTTPLADVLGRPQEFERLHQQLAEAEDHGRRVRILEEFLLTRLCPSAPDPLVTAAVAWLQRSTGSHRIGDLAKYIGLSQSALERRFRRTVGMSPKKFASLLRFRRAVRLRERGMSLTVAAHDAGYFDQSHFISDFRRVTGSAPGAFLHKPSIG